jgi:serine/threonine protein kinase
VNLFKAFKYKDKYLLLMEYIDNKFDEKMKDQKNIKEKIIIFYKLMKGVMILHKEGYIHADLKLENILVNKDLKVKICDFSLA